MKLGRITHVLFLGLLLRCHADGEVAEQEQKQNAAFLALEQATAREIRRIYRDAGLDGAAKVQALRAWHEFRTSEIAKIKSLNGERGAEVPSEKLPGITVSPNLAVEPDIVKQLRGIGRHYHAGTITLDQFIDARAAAELSLPKVEGHPVGLPAGEEIVPAVARFVSLPRDPLMREMVVLGRLVKHMPGSEAASLLIERRAALEKLLPIRADEPDPGSSRGNDAPESLGSGLEND